MYKYAPIKVTQLVRCCGLASSFDFAKSQQCSLALPELRFLVGAIYNY